MSMIYKATNRVNGKQYVGMTIVSLRSRESSHQSRAKTEPDHNYPFVKALRKYDRSDWDWQVLEECSPDVIGEREQYWIEQLQPYYNSTKGGDGGRTGYVPLQEERDKIRNSSYHKKKARPVSAYKNGKLVKTYPSLMAAARDVGCNKAAIQKVLRPDMLTMVSAMGYNWKDA